MSFSDVYGPTTKENSLAILRRALELGIDHIDTANVYGLGRSEEVIGEFLKCHGGPSPFKISTKAGICRNRPTDKRSFNNEAAHLEGELDKSLKRLGVERVDLFYVHRRSPDQSIEEVTETLSSFVKAGKIGGFGFSEIAPSSLRRANEVAEVAAVQSEYSLATRLPEIGLLQACRTSGTAFVAFSPLCRGLLTDTPPDSERVAQSFFLPSNPRFNGRNLDRNLAIVAGFQALAAEFGTSGAALAIAWLLHRGPHVIPIPGTRSVEHLDQLAEGASLSLSEADLARIEEVLPSGWAHGDRYSVEQWVGPERYA